MQAEHEQVMAGSTGGAAMGGQTAGSVARHTGVALAGNLLNQACFLVATVFIARELGRAQFGIYSSAMAIAIILSTVASGGLDVILVREISRAPENAGTFVGSAILLKAGLSLVVLLGLAGIGSLAGVAPPLRRALWIATLANLVRIHERSCVSVFRALGNMASEGAVLALQGALYALTLIVAVAWIRDAGDAFLALLGSYLASFSVGVVLMLHLGVRPRLTRALPAGRFLGREALPVGVAAVLAYLYERLPILALQVLRGASEVALFSGAFGLVRNTGVVPLVLSGAALPVLSRLAPHARPRLERTYGAIARLLLALSLPVAIALVLLAEPIMTLVFGAEYVAGYRVLQVSSASIVLYFLAFLAKAGLEATNQQGRWTRVLAASTIGGIALQVGCISWLGLEGAAVGLVAADALVLALAMHALRRHMTVPWAGGGAFAAKCLAAGGVMTAVLGGSSGVYPAVRLLVAGMAYLATLVALRGLSDEEVAFARSVFRRDRGPKVAEAMVGRGNGPEVG